MSEDSRQKVVMARKVRMSDADRSFDLEFWQRVGGPRRFEAAWDAVLDLVRMGKLDEDQLRLRRSSTRLLRRGS